MPRIRAFQGIHPSAEVADKIVVKLENYALEDAKIIRENNPISFIHMLVPKLNNPVRTGSRLEWAYKTINFNFEQFLNKGILVQDLKHSLYIYQIKHLGIEQTGIWTLTCINDYLDNTIKKHEFTLPEREKKLVEYLQNTGIDTNPVLITYPPHAQINRIVNDHISSAPFLWFKKDNSEHRLWRIEDEETLRKLESLFSSLPASYIADGHHRAAAATSYALERRKIDFLHTGKEDYNFFSSVYIATDQVKIFEFNRAVRDLNGNTPAGFLSVLESKFKVKRAVNNEAVKPTTANKFGMYLQEVWYELNLIEENHKSDEQLNVEILQTLVFNDLLNIQDPRKDARIDFFSGVNPVENLTKKVDQREYAAVFTLAPIEIGQLIQFADKGLIMPPKSTYFEPKFFLGLLTHRISLQ